MPKIATRQQYILGGALVVLAAIGLFGLLPQLGGFKDSMQVLKQADPGLTVAAAAASIAGVICSAGIYMTLAVRHLHFGNTLLVQLGGMLINRVLPAGIGGLGLNYLYLRAHKHNVAQATTVVTLNNTIGFLGHMLLTASLIVLLPTAVAGLNLPAYWWLSVVGVGVLFVLVVMIVRRFRPRAFNALHRVAGYYRQRPLRLIQALGISLLLTTANVASLWLCCQALDISLSPLAVFAVFTAGIALGTATPTPGGLGGVEAGLVGALVAQGITASTALAVALLYRLVSYWFGLLVGGLAMFTVLRRQLLG